MLNLPEPDEKSVVEPIVRKHEPQQKKGVGLMDEGAGSTTKKIVKNSVESMKRLSKFDVWVLLIIIAFKSTMKEESMPLQNKHNKLAKRIFNLYSQNSQSLSNVELFNMCKHYSVYPVRLSCWLQGHRWLWNGKTHHEKRPNRLGPKEKRRLL